MRWLKTVSLWSAIRCSLGLAALACLQVAATPCFAQSETASQAWPLDASDLAPNPAIVWGVLPNGMRYALMRNQLPPGAVSIRLSIRFGSLNEADNEKGLAHFLEHMAFNGSKHVPEGDMAKMLERLGLGFGPDLNASTEQKFTTYTLRLPNASEDTLGQSFFLVREIASELSLDPAAVDRERGVVLAELRRGDTLASRRRDAQLSFLTPGAYAASRLPLGDPKVVGAATSTQLASLYERFYRPERAVLVVAGDFDVEGMKERIASTFADWQGKGTAGPDRDFKYVVGERPAAALVSTDSSGGDAIGVYALSAFSDRPDTEANRKDDMLLSIAVGIVNKRLAARVNTVDPPFRAASLSWASLLDLVYYAGASIAVTPQSWKPGLQAVEQEWRRALLYGFSQAEVDQQLSILRTVQANAAAREATRTTDSLAEALLFSIQNDKVPTTASSTLARFDVWSKSFTPTVINEVFRRRMSAPAPLIVMFSSKEHPGLEKDLIEAWRESSLKQIGPPAEVQRQPFAYTYFGPPGTVARDEAKADLGARLITFNNNVHLNLKKTTYEKNSVLVSVRIGEGAIALEGAPFGLAQLMNAYAAGGLEKHSIDQLRTTLGDRSVKAGFLAYQDFFGGVYATTPRDLLLQLQLAAAYLTHPGYRPEAERNWRQGIVLGWSQMDANAQATFSNRATRLLASGDKRFGSDPDDGAIYRSFVELKAYLDPLLKDAPIEIAIVGDIDEAAAIAAVAETFGALPERQKGPRLLQSRTPVRFSRAPIVLHHQGEASQALFKEYWPVDIDPALNPQALRTLGLLSAIMKLKLTEVVRERLGISYAPTSGFSSSTIFSGLNYLFAEIETKPDQIDEVEAIIGSITAAMRSGEISEDELARARSPGVDQLLLHATENGYWLSVLAQAQTRPEEAARLNLPNIAAELNAVTVADLIAAANLWLTDANRRTVRVLPPAPKS